MVRRQRGVTAIGWVFLLIPVALVVYGGIRVAPHYLNYYKVVQALKKTAVELQGDEVLSAQGIRAALEKRFDVGYIDSPTAKDIVITRDDAGWTMAADYEEVVPMLGNLFLLMQFKSTVVID
jgi:hypothetical protein